MRRLSIHAAACAALVTFLDTLDHRVRLHSSVGYRPPDEFEARLKSACMIDPHRDPWPCHRRWLGSVGNDHSGDDPNLDQEGQPVELRRSNARDDGHGRARGQVSRDHSLDCESSAKMRPSSAETSGPRSARGCNGGPDTEIAAALWMSERTRHLPPWTAPS